MTDASAMVRRLALVRFQIGAACRAAGRAENAVRLLAVGKQQPAAAIRAAYAAGQREFGENRVQELAQKAGELADLTELRWHMIGSLQTNKVRDLLQIAGLALLHSLDRARLADELQHELERTGRSLDVLLQLHMTGEASKHGCPPADAPALIEHVQARCPALRLQGVMAMGPLEGDPVPTFAAVAAVHDELRRRSGLPLPIRSLGMSGDLEAAIAAGSTLVRIGTAVFGPRG